jgi:N-methylhydantoinase B
MTNTLNTPIEALELEYPMRVEQYELAAGSGGAGLHPGGDGVVRAIRVLEDATLSLLTDRRRHQPAGAHGGGPGAPGQNLLNDRPLPAKVSKHLTAGDVVTVITPGGGGWGGPDGADGRGTGATDGADGRGTGATDGADLGGSVADGLDSK